MRKSSPSGSTKLTLSTSATALLHIIHEDADLLVLNKPAGLVCHPTKTDEMSSLIGRVRLHLGNREGRLINRLDRETSGLVLVARDSIVAGELGRLLAGSGVQKIYWAIVHGQRADDSFAIDAPLGRDPDSPVAIKDRVREDGAPARTVVRVRCRFHHQRAPMMWVEVSPQTGRKHQIRIHLAHAGHAIVGDKIYGSDAMRYLRFIAGAMTDEDRAALVLPHHALHARRLAFSWRNRDWEFTADPDAAFKAMLAACPT